MKRGDAFPSRYFKGSELDGETAVTIKSVMQEMVGQGDDQQLKVVVSFSRTIRASL